MSELKAAGWRIELSPGHAWARAYCPDGLNGCPPVSIWSTPRVPEHFAAFLRHKLRQCVHGTKREDKS